MKANFGGFGKLLKLAAGAGLLSSVVLLDGDARWWGLIGLVPLLSGILGYCPLCALLGMRTCSVRNMG